MSATSPLTEMREFLSSKYPSTTPGWRMVWSKQSRKTVAFRSDEIDRMVAYVAKTSKSDDLYISISTQAAAPPNGRRGAEDGVEAVTGLFLDVDFASDKGPGSGYVEDAESAKPIIDALPLQPTMMVASGRGLHLHFEFSTPVIIGTPEKRSKAKRLFEAFQRVCQERFRARGHKIDAVGDLVRGVRIPGTLNHGCNPPRVVRMLEVRRERRYSTSQVEAASKAGKAPANPKRARSRSTEPLADHKRIIRGCGWYRTIVVEGAATCLEPDWFAGASITALCRDGESIFHAYSSGHPRYGAREAAAKFKNALKHGAPRTCKSVAEDLGHKTICEACPHFEKITSPLQLGRAPYEAGRDGPLPIGFTAEGSYVFRDQTRKILLLANSSQLLSLQYLVGIAPLQFWAGQFPSKKAEGSANPWEAGQRLMEECRSNGPFDPRTVRGRGVWLEGDRVIVNLGDPLPSDVHHIYLCFEPLPLRSVKSFETRRLQQMLERFVWRNPQDATLLLGWLAIAPICGVLGWRPHCFIYGPPNCGKSTIHGIASDLLRPLGLSADGQSSEAGIRQMIKADSRPVVIDEFESDQGRSHLAGVIRLARSASSSESPVLRGTPEGKAMQFTLRTCFFFAAVNPSGMSSADATRILMFEMLAHDNEPEAAARIADDQAFFAERGPEWCGYIAGLAHLIPPAIAAFTRALPGIDSRHRRNVATLLAGAFVAIERNAPTDEQAQEMAASYKASIDLHAEAFERDDSLECLQHLFAYPVEKQTLGFWLAVAAAGERGTLPDHRMLQENAKRIPRNFEIVVRDGEEPGFLIRNGSPPVETIFRDTKWARGAWERALRKINGYFAPRNPIHFAASKGKHRAIGLPLDLLPDVDPEEIAGDYASDFRGQTY